MRLPFSWSCPFDNKMYRERARRAHAKRKCKNSFCRLFRKVGRSGRRGTAQREEGPQPAIAQVETAPSKNADIDPEEDLAEKRILQPYFAGDRAAQKTRQKDGAKNSGSRHSVQNSASKTDNSEGAYDIHRIANSDGRIHHWRDHHQLRDAIEQ